MDHQTSSTFFETTQDFFISQKSIEVSERWQN
jgi:hypothetical protein